MDIVMSDGIYVNIGFLVVSLLALGLVYLASQRLQHRTARERSLVILLILALIPAYFIVSDWEDIAWELTMASK
jgi:putative Ca2+/H+ antiporter (TMEM165/GDT1 family)